MFENHTRKMGYVFPKRIQQIMHGETPVIKVGWNSALEKSDEYKITRKIGDTWTDENGHEWEQKDGYVTRINTMHQLIQDMIDKPTNCPRCNKKLEGYIDEKFLKYENQCFECQIDYDTYLQSCGKFFPVQQLKIKNNHLSFLQDSRAEIIDYLNGLDTKGYVTEDGQIEKWSGDMSQAKAFFNQELIDIDDAEKELLAKISDLEKEVGNVKEDFESNPYWTQLKEERRNGAKEN